MRPHLVTSLAAGACIVLLGICLLRLHAADADLAAARTQAERQLADLRRWSQQRARIAGVAAGSAAGADVVTQVQQAVAAAGLPATAFRGVQPLAERAEPGTGVIERTVNVHLVDLRPADAGAWLAAWMTPTQPWEVISLAWSHPPTAAESAVDNDRYQLTLSLLLRTVVSP